MASLVAELAGEEVAGVPEELDTPPRRRWRPRVTRSIVLAFAAAYFLIPLYAGLRFSFENDNNQTSLSTVTSITSQPGLSDAFWLSTRLAIVATVIGLALMVPTTVYVHLRLPKLRPVMDLVTLLPIVFPPIVLILGVLHVAPLSLRNSPYLLAYLYVILAMPFWYRSIDSGLNALDLKTLVEAAQSLGARWVTMLLRVVVPNLTTAIIGGFVLSVALVYGEYTMASLDQWSTLPVWIVEFNQTDGHVTVAVSMLALIATWLLLSLVVVLDMIRSRRTRLRRARAV